MQITALLQSINFLKEKSGDPSLVEGYSKLAEMTREATGNRDSDFSAAVHKEKEKLHDILMESEPSEWGHASYSLFEKMNINQLFGKAAADHLDQLIVPGKEDYKAIHAELSKKIKLISKLSDSLGRFIQLFDQLVPSEIAHIDDEAEQKFSLFLHFEGHLSVRSVPDMERYSRLWDGILKTFSKLTGIPNPDLDLISFIDGNFTLGAAVDDKVIKAVSDGVLGILGSLPLILQIRKTQIDIANLPLKKDINLLLEEEIQSLVDLKALELTNTLVSDYNNNYGNPDDIENEISRSLKQILNFVEKRGKIEFRPQIITQEIAKINKSLKGYYKLALEIEKIAHQISHTQVKNELTTLDSETVSPSQTTE